MDQTSVKIESVGGDQLCQNIITNAGLDKTGSINSNQDVSGNAVIIGKHCDENNGYGDASISNLPAVTVEEARQGLITVINYLQAHPPDRYINMEIFLDLLEYFNQQVNGCYEYTNKEDETQDSIHGCNDTLINYVTVEQDAVKESGPLNPLDSANNVDPLGNAYVEARGPYQKAKRKLRPRTIAKSSKKQKTCSITRKKKLNTPERQVMCDGLNEQLGLDLKVSDKPETTGIGSDDLSIGEKYSQQSNRETKIKKINICSEYVCEECGHRCRLESTLAKHMRIHARKKIQSESSSILPMPKDMFYFDEDRQVYQCKLCTHYCTNVRKQHYHAESHRDYKCSICSKQIRTRTDLTKHMKIHKKKSLLSCRYCNQGFHEAAQLEEHIRIHSGKFILPVNFYIL